MTKKQTSGKSIIIVWILIVNILGATIVTEFVTNIHAVFSIEEKIFFYSWYGFIICTGIILLSKFLGFFLKRQEGYYRERRND